MWIRFLLILLTLVAPSIGWAKPASDAAQGAPYLSIYADTSHSSTSVSGTPWYRGELWVWGLPDSRGMMAVEFALAYPSNVSPLDIIWNPAVAVHLGEPTWGISASFGACQNGWAWIMRQPFWVTSSDRSEIRLLAHPISGIVSVGTCEPGYPVYPAQGLWQLYINSSCTQEDRDRLKPRLSSVSVIAPNTLLAAFSNWLSHQACWWGTARNLRVINLTSPPETIQVVKAEQWEETNNVLLLQLGQDLIPNTDYVLEATHICNFFLGCECCCMCQCMNCADSEMGFSYAPIAALLRDFSVERMPGGIRVSWTLGTADEGITFAPMRLAKGAAEFEPVRASIIEERRLEYWLLDSDVRPATVWKYRIDYTLGGARSRLFETDWIEALPVKFALHPNVPNPFNPSTRISFELAEHCHATLAVYNVSGRLVRTLVDEALPAGEHAALWDGRLESGDAAASGIYFYRLRAGSFTETRKMVLLQ